MDNTNIDFRILASFRCVGLTEPAEYIPALAFIFCLISLLLPISQYYVARNLVGRRIGVIAFSIACFWPDYIFFASRPMPGALATYAIFGAIALASGKGLPIRLFIAGMLAGFGLVLRYQLLPFVGVLGLYFLFIHWKSAGWIVAGLALTILVLGGILDWFTWGGIFSSYIENFKLNFTYKVSEVFGVKTWLFYPKMFVSYTFGLVLVGAMGAAFEWRKLAPYILAVGVGVAALMIPAHKEYRFLFWCVPFIVLGLAIAIDKFSFDRASNLSNIHFVSLFIPAWVVFSVIANLTFVSSIIHRDSPIFGGVCADQISLTRELSSFQNLTGVFVDDDYPWWCSGGYYYFGRKIPVYFSDWDQGAQSMLDQHVSHFVATSSAAPLGWRMVERHKSYLIYENPNMTSVRFPEGWTYATPSHSRILSIPASAVPRFP